MNHNLGMPVWKEIMHVTDVIDTLCNGTTLTPQKNAVMRRHMTPVSYYHYLKTSQTIFNTLDEIKLRYPQNVG